MIDTYDREIFESLGTFNDASLNDRTDFLTLPPDLAEICKAHVANGAIPSERQPTDSFVVTDNHVVVTLTWLNLEAAQQYSANKLASNNTALISSEVVER